MVAQFQWIDEEFFSHRRIWLDYLEEIQGRFYYLFKKWRHSQPALGRCTATASRINKDCSQSKPEAHFRYMWKVVDVLYRLSKGKDVHREVIKECNELIVILRKYMEQLKIPSDEIYSDIDMEILFADERL